MPIVSTSIPNLINGVSQQPAALRLASQAERQINALPSVVEGLTKRPPTKHIARLMEGTLPGAYIHLINRDITERYVVMASDGDLKIFDIDGNEKVVNFPNGKAYLAAPDPKTDYRAITIADYTFLVNSNITVEMAEESSPSRGVEAIVFIKQVNYSTKYTVKVNGKEASITVGPGTATSPPTTNPEAAYVSQAAAAEGVDANTIWKELALLSTAALNSGRIADFLRWRLLDQLGAGWEITRNGPVLWIKRTDSADFEVKIEDSRSNTQMYLAKQTVQRFSELPTVAPTGFTVEVVGDNTSNFDNYYVKFEPNNESAAFDQGVWKETVKPGIPWKFNKDTMPHAIVREADGTFSFKQLEWGNRECGDEDSAPAPTFVGRRINDIFFHKNRLGFLADENVCMSRAGEFFEFFATTVTTLIDSDPVDVAASHTKVSILRHAVPFNEQLILFSDQTQFVLKANSIVASEPPDVATLTEFESSLRAKPVGAGKTVFFATLKGDYSGIREYFIEDDTQAKDAADITGHVPTYIPAGVFKLSVAANEDILFALTEREPNRVYVYKYYWSGNEKMQSAWSHFTFADEARVLNVDFIDNKAYLIIQYPDGVYLEAMQVSPGRTDPGSPFEYQLDRKITDKNCLSIEYDPVADRTTWTLPYKIAGEMNIVTRPPVGDETSRLKIGVVLTICDQGTTTLKVAGNYADVPVYIGQKYTLVYEFSKQVLKEEAAGGGQAIVGEGRLQLRFWSVVYSNSGFFLAKVTPLHRDTYIHKFTGRVIGSGTSRIGRVALESGTFKFPVMSKNDRVTVVLENDTFLPCQFLSGEWEGLYTIRSKRL